MGRGGSGARRVLSEGESVAVRVSEELLDFERDVQEFEREMGARRMRVLYGIVDARALYGHVPREMIVCEAVMPNAGPLGMRPLPEVRIG